MKEYPCETCQIEVADNDNSILCNLCDKWHHTICVDVIYANYEKLKVGLKTLGFSLRVLKKYGLAMKDHKNLLSNGFPKKSILQKLDQKTKIHLEKF